MRPLWLTPFACLLVLSCCAATASAADLTISGDPLQITVSDNLSMVVLRDEGTGFDQQYYDTYDTYLRLTDANGTTVSSGIGGGFTLISHTQPTTYSISTVVSAGDQVQITQDITYTNGDQFYTHTWTVINNGTTTYTASSLLYGGDSFFHNSDSASGVYDAAQHFVYCVNPNQPGLMGMYADPTTPAAHYVEGPYSTVDSDLAGPADLPDTIDSTFIDNGMGLQWDHGSLAPSQSFTIIAYEKWDATTSIQVTPPAPTSVTAGAPFTVHFIVDNLQSSSDIFDLVTSVTPGFTINTAPTSVSVPANSTAGVDITVTPGTGTANSTGTVSLTATSRAIPALSNQNNVQITVNALVTTNTVVFTPLTLPVSNSGVASYVPICPSTPEGIASLLAVFGDHDQSEAAAYAWDASIQRYVRLPQQPSGGLQVGSGLFVATRVPLDLDFSGTLSTLPWLQVLQPGWNLVGIPPLDNGSPITSHSFPTDFELLDQFSSLVTTISQFTDTLGTVGSNDLLTARPYDYTGSGYAQVSTLDSGHAYWIKNNAPAAVTLRRTLSAVVLSTATPHHHGLSAGPGKGTSTYADHGSPPSSPASRAADAAGGCGQASGLAGLVGFLVLALRRGRNR